MTVRLATLFNKRTMWKKRIADSVRAAGGAAMKDFMRLVWCWSFWKKPASGEVTAQSGELAESAHAGRLCEARVGDINTCSIRVDVMEVPGLEAVCAILCKR